MYSNNTSAAPEPCEHRSEHIQHSETTPLLDDSSTQTSKPSSPPSHQPHTHYDLSSELWLLLQFSIPLIATYFLQYTWSVIVTYVAGHLDALDLAAASVGITTMNIVGYAIFEGMATALDTLCSQAYGSNNLTGVGVQVQKMLILSECPGAVLQY